MKKALLFSFTIALLSCGPSASDNAAAEQEKLTKKLNAENKEIQYQLDLLELKKSKIRKDNDYAMSMLLALELFTKEQLVNYLTANDTTRLKLQSYTKEQLKVYNLIQLDSIFSFGLTAKMDEDLLRDGILPPTPPVE